MSYCNWPVAAVLLGLLFMVIFRKEIAGLLQRTRKITREGIETASSQQASQTGKPTADDLMRTFDSPVVKEREEGIRKEVEAASPGDPQKQADVLIRHLAALQLAYAFEVIHSLIYGSQIRLLYHLNESSNGESADDLMIFYEEAAVEWPEAYSHYTYENYLKFLADVPLITDQSGRYGITGFGREFLSYLVNAGRPLTKPL